jgi:hypothetical protein
VHASSSATPPPATHTAAPAYPTAAPETGGGETAGLQDGVLFGAGGMAVLVGFGTLAYRRRLSRKFATGHPAPRDPANPDPAPRDPASR